MPTIVLLTDFGSKDYFVGVMKGVISSINPVARIIDLTHEIEPQNVKQAAFALWASRNFFPEDSIFVAVVDPGVGTDRRIICGDIDGRKFIAPDNGLLDYVVADAEKKEFHLVGNRRLFLENTSTTFHGRDIFAPVAAYLSRGTRLNELGDIYIYPGVTKFYREIVAGRNDGVVVYHDRFGNVFTNLLWNESLLKGNAVLKIGSIVVSNFIRAYGEYATKGPVGVMGSSGLLEIAVNRGNAARTLRSAIGRKVTLTLK